MNRVWGGIDFNDFIKSTVLLGSLYVENLIHSGELIMRNIASAWVYKYGLEGQTVSWFYPTGARNAAAHPPKQKKMKLLSKQEEEEYIVKSVRCRDGTTIRVFMAGLVDGLAVCWIGLDGILNFISGGKKSKKHTLKKLHNMMIEWKTNQ
jgi:hypothetical protein